MQSFATGLMPCHAFTDETGFIGRIEDRIARWTMTDVGQGEGIQVLRYDVSQYLYDVLLPVGFSNKDTCYWLVLGPLRTVLF